MLDEESQRILVSKKIAQLVKLIDHLNFQNAQRDFKIECENKSFEKQLTDSQKENTEILTKINNEIVEFQNKSDQNQKSLFEKQYHELVSEYEIQVVSCQSDLTEASISFSRNISNMQVMINSINNEIDVYSQSLNDSIDQKRQIFHQEFSKINKKHQSVLDALDKESQDKLNSLQEQTSRKLDTLDRDFNRSLTSLKAKFGQPELDSIKQKEFDVSFTQLNQKVLKFQQSINMTKQELNFILSNSKAIFKEYKSKIFSSIKELKSINENGKLNISNLEKELDLLELNFSNLKKEYESRKNEMALSFNSLQNIYNDLNQSNLKEIQEKQLLTDLAKRKTKESGEFICQEIDKNIVEIENEFNKDKEKYQEQFNQFENELQKIQSSIQIQSDELSKLKQTHQSEQKIFFTTQNKAIEEFKLFNQNEIKELKRKHSQNSEIDKKIDVNREILNTLLFEHASLISMNGIINDPEIEETKRRYEKERKELIRKLNKEFETVVKEEKALLDLQAETQRNAIFEKNGILASKYDAAMANIRMSFKRQNFIEEINQEYQKLMEKLNHELHIYETSNNNSNQLKEFDNDIGKFTKIINELKEKYTAEKKKLNKDYLLQQKNEEDRYLKRLAEINYKGDVHHEEYETIREEYHIKLQKLDMKIKDLKIELSELQGNDNNIINKLNMEFDEEEKQLNDLLDSINKNAESSIQKMEKKFASKKKEILSKIHKIKIKLKKLGKETKLENEEREELILEANEEALDQSEKLQQKVEAASNRLMKHFNKQNNKLNKEHEKHLNEINEKVSNEKQTNANLKEELEKSIENAKNQSESELEQLKSEVESQLNVFKTENDAKIQELDDLLDKTVNKLEQLKIDVIDGKSRDEELNILERLETHLKIQENQLKDSAKCIKDYKVKLVQQDGVYNSHFGTQPSVAVLRPTTAAVSIPINKRLKQQRPVTVSLQMRPMSYLKNRNKKNDVSLKKKEITVT